ncbi:MAG TPA: hypothetical protein VER98_12645 [Terriglobia bacterium]|nr:hypothetical protein [Terriglobia bacterium]
MRNIEAWIFGFARNVKRENVRPTPVVFGIEIDAGAPVEKDAESAETEERWYADMRSCLERLTDSERRLIVRYFTNPNGISRAEHRAQISGELGVTVNALRIRITKIKSLLTKYRQQPAGPRRDLVSKNRN